MRQPDQGGAVPGAQARARLKTGLAAGALLAVFAAVFAVLGLSPNFRWIPEVPLIGAGLLVPVLICAFAGRRAGILAAALAGAIGGAAGGIAYVAYGKPLLNVPIGIVGGAIGGAVVGFLSLALPLPRSRAGSRRGPGG